MGADGMIVIVNVAVGAAPAVRVKLAANVATASVRRRPRSVVGFACRKLAFRALRTSAVIISAKRPIAARNRVPTEEGNIAGGMAWRL